MPLSGVSTLCPPPPGCHSVPSGLSERLPCCRGAWVHVAFFLLNDGPEAQEWGCWQLGHPERSLQGSLQVKR